ncbi:hypothetical protein ASPCAL08721 [Aspergillus calidoustus]|uniref:aldehyde dehydrogenase (NAD(+)) n=1 Tax=Aspergillus calidoustus TaxID=454130 RepID=A0A0U5GW06_ASPCI|nr:hypothetical protein ASPCAL08721 [Aspergillus calidoustus]
MKEEIFDPVVNINVFEEEAGVIRLVNASEFGLYPAVYTRDVSLAMRMATAIQVGTVGINCTSPSGEFDMPLGGYKASGIRMEAIHHSLENYETKTVLMSVNSL